MISVLKLLFHVALWSLLKNTAVVPVCNIFLKIDTFAAAAVEIATLCDRC